MALMAMKEKLFSDDMVVCAFQQNGIPELVPKAEINAHRGVEVCRHLSECGAQLNLVHFFHAAIDFKNKSPE